MSTPNPSIGTVVIARRAAALLLAFNLLVQAQDNVPAAPAPADAPAIPAQSEMQKWIATTDAQWQAVFQRDVSDVHETELEKLKQQYVASLAAEVTKASGAGDLDGAIALRNEEKRFAGTNVFPEQDDAADAAPVKKLRAAIRTQIARLDKEKATRSKSLHTKYDHVLSQAQTQLTQRGRLDDALLVKTKRDEVAAAWLPGIPATAVAAVAEQPKPQPPVPGPAGAEAPEPEIAGRNLFKNPNFEHGTDGWELVAFGKKGTMSVDKKELHNGKPSLRIDNPEGGLTFVRQKVAGKPNTHYLFSGYIMTKDVEPEKAGKDWGACLMVGFTAEVYVGQSQAKARGGKSASIQKTKQWTKVTVDYTSGSKTDLPVGGALGYYNENVTGTAWFSELSLVELGHKK